MNILEVAKVILVIAVLIIPCWIVLGWMIRKLLGIDRATKAESMSEAYENEAANRDAYRRHLLESGEREAYREQEAIDKAWANQKMREIVAAETCIDERTQYELDHGINPYKKAPAPSGRTARAKR